MAIQLEATPVSTSKTRIAVVFDPESRYAHWSNEAESLLNGFADWRPVHLDPRDSPQRRAAHLDSALGDADGLLLCGWMDLGIGYLSSRRLDSYSRLRFIGATCHYRHAEFIDVAAATARGITICETAPLMAPWVAEYELALALASLRRIPQEHAILGQGGWVTYHEDRGARDRLEGSRVGLASFGAIHRNLVRYLAPFEVQWEAQDPFVPAHVMEAAGGQKAEDLASMAAKSEVLFVATPPNPQTLRSIGPAVFEALPVDAVFVLVGRMATVDQAALIRRLQRGDLRAGIDVYDPEPPPSDLELLSLPNVVHTPHRAGGTLSAHRRVFLGQCEEAQRYFRGEPLQFPLRMEIVGLFSRGDLVPT